MVFGEFRQSLCEGLVWLEQLAGGDGVPGQEGDSLLLAPGQCLLVAAVGEGVAILHTDDGDDLLHLLDLFGADFAEADVADFALLLHLFQRTQAFFERGAGIDAVELVELDALEFEAAQAHFDTLDQVAGAANVFGFGWSLASDAALGGDDELCRVRVQRLADEAFRSFGAVGVGGVDKVDAEVNGASQDAAGFIEVIRLSPGSLADKSHRSVAKAVDGEVAANLKGAARGGIASGHDGYDAKGQG